MSRCIPSIVVALWVSGAPAALLWDNGEFITHPGYPAWSECSMTRNIAGYNFSSGQGAWVADDFTVPPGQWWQINSVEFFGYQTGSSTNSTFAEMYIRIFNGSPMAGANVVWGDSTTNRLSFTRWTGAYRVFNGSIGNTQRPIMSLTAVFEGPVLTSGTYYIAVSTVGDLNLSGPWAVPTEPEKPTDNAEQCWGGAWQLMAGWTNRADLPFRFHGLPEPAGGVLLLGLGLLLRRR